MPLKTIQVEGARAKPTKAKRKTISKSTRFEVFKRDKFTCQYCGRKAPDIVLVVDHIHPVASGGGNEILNLVTSCNDCNSGKGARKLSDQSTLEKQKRQLTELQEREEQIDMLFEWKKGLLKLDDICVNKLKSFWEEKVPGMLVSDHGVNEFRGLTKKYTLEEIIEAIEASTTRHVEIVNGKATTESANKAFDAVQYICGANRFYAKKPHMRDVHYIRGILRRRLSYWKNSHDADSVSLLEDAIQAGVAVEALKDVTKKAYEWDQWFDDVLEMIEKQTPKGN